MWVPTEYEAVLMYAQFLKARHGTAASKLARNTAKTLQDEGDLEGHKIWDAVADAMDVGVSRCHEQKYAERRVQADNHQRIV